MIFYMFQCHSTLQYCNGFAIYQNESTTGIHASLLMFHDLQVSIQMIFSAEESF